MKSGSFLPAVFVACALCLAEPPAAGSAEPAAGTAVAKVIALSGEARAGTRILQVGGGIAVGENIMSGRGGYATIEFSDYSVIHINPDTRLRIETHRASSAPGAFETRLRLGAGALEAAVARRGAPDFSIASLSGSIATRGADFRVRGGDEAMLVEVLRGSVAVAGTSGWQTVTVDAGHGTRVRAMEAPLVPVKLLGAPDASSVAQLQQRPVVRLRFAPLAGAQSYRIVAAMDRDLREVILENMQRRPEVRMVDLRDGEYFYGVRAIDALGLEGAEARGRFRLKARPLPPVAQAPELEAVLQPGNVAFRWLAAEEAVAYRFQLATEEAFAAPLVNRGALPARELTVENLEAGRYYWRVASVRADGDQGPFSDPHRLTLRAPLPERQTQ